MMSRLGVLVAGVLCVACIDRPVPSIDRPGPQWILWHSVFGGGMQSYIMYDPKEGFATKDGCEAALWIWMTWAKDKGWSLDKDVFNGLGDGYTLPNGVFHELRCLPDTVDPRFRYQ
jgi:hypothetical protein